MALVAATAPVFEAEAVLPAGSAEAGMGGGGTVLFGPEASFDTVDPAAANTNVPCDADDPMPTALGAALTASAAVFFARPARLTTRRLPSGNISPRSPVRKYC